MYGPTILAFVLGVILEQVASISKTETMLVQLVEH